MFTGCFIIMCGTSIIATALTQHQVRRICLRDAVLCSHSRQFIAGRFVLGEHIRASLTLQLRDRSPGMGIAIAIVGAPSESVLRTRRVSGN